MGLEFTNGLIRESIKGNGIIVIWKVMAFIKVQMVENIWGNSTKIKSMVMAYITGKMAENIKATLKMESNMGWEFTKCQRKSQNVGYGRMERE